jgi:hypothetical protein
MMRGQQNIKECELKFCSETLEDLESWEDIMTDFRYVDFVDMR